MPGQSERAGANERGQILSPQKIKGVTAQAVTPCCVLGVDCVYCVQVVRTAPTKLTLGRVKAGVMYNSSLKEKLKVWSPKGLFDHFRNLLICGTIYFISIILSKKPEFFDLKIISYFEQLDIQFLGFAAAYLLKIVASILYIVNFAHAIISILKWTGNFSEPVRNNVRIIFVFVFLLYIVVTFGLIGGITNVKINSFKAVQEVVHPI